MRLYREFGVEAAPRALLDPRAWGPLLVAVGRQLCLAALGRDRAPAIRQPNGRLGLPADFLISPDGRVAAVKYGRHAYDQWAVDDILALAAEARRSASVG